MEWIQGCDYPERGNVIKALDGGGFSLGNPPKTFVVAWALIKPYAPVVRSGTGNVDQMLLWEE